MSSLARLGSLLTAAVLLISSSHILSANDSAASTAAGGIQLRREANISMEKEVLTISEAKVTVEYEFLNESDKNITTEVAFPTPPYDDGWIGAAGRRDFNDFRLWVDGRPLKYNTDARANLSGKDYTALLNRLKIDIASLGHYGDNTSGDPSGQINALKPADRAQLLRLGLVSGAGDSPPWEPLWKVLKTYYWTETFPAHKILRIRHEYSPGFGFEEITPDTLDPVVRRNRLSALRAKAHSPAETIGGTSLLALQKLYRNIDNSCVDPSLEKVIIEKAAKKYKPEEDALAMAWVDYILTTANSWKTPIKDFTLVIDRQQAQDVAVAPQYVSLCWDGLIKKSGANRFEAHRANFIPQKDLHILYLSIQ